MKNLAIIVDFDGTLYDCEARRIKHLTADKKDFEAFNAEAIKDQPHYWCQKLCQAMKFAGFSVIFVSGREEKHHRDAVKWLKKHLNWNEPDYYLYMRPTGDYRKDSEIKREIYENCIWPVFDILFCVDDRKQVVDFWRSIGLTCLHCAEGDF